MKWISHIKHLLSTMIASNFRLWLVFLKVLAKSGAPVKRLSTNWAKVLGLSCEKMKSHVINRVSRPSFQHNLVIFQKFKFYQDKRTQKQCHFTKTWKKTSLNFLFPFKTIASSRNLTYCDSTVSLTQNLCRWEVSHSPETFLGEEGGKRTGALDGEVVNRVVKGKAIQRKWRGEPPG